MFEKEELVKEIKNLKNLIKDIMIEYERTKERLAVLENEEKLEQSFENSLKNQNQNLLKEIDSLHKEILKISESNLQLQMERIEIIRDSRRDIDLLNELNKAKYEKENLRMQMKNLELEKLELQNKLVSCQGSNQDLSFNNYRKKSKIS